MQDPVGEVHGLGCRNKQSFVAIRFHCGALDMAPEATK
jgi:hypothetical protein